MSVGIRKMPADICCCCWLSLAKKRRNKKNTVFLPQCLYQGSSATGMWFSGRFVIFFISCSSAFLLLRNVCVREIPRRVCVFWKVYNFFVFPFLSRSSAFLFFRFSAPFFCSFSSVFIFLHFSQHV